MRFFRWIKDVMGAFRDFWRTVFWLTRYGSESTAARWMVGVIAVVTVSSGYLNYIKAPYFVGVFAGMQLGSFWAILGQKVSYARYEREHYLAFHRIINNPTGPDALAQEWNLDE